MLSGNDQATAYELFLEMDQADAVLLQAAFKGYTGREEPVAHFDSLLSQWNLAGLATVAAGVGHHRDKVLTMYHPAGFK